MAAAVEADGRACCDNAYLSVEHLDKVLMCWPIIKLQLEPPSPPSFQQNGDLSLTWLNMSIKRKAYPANRIDGPITQATTTVAGGTVDKTDSVLRSLKQSGDRTE